MRTIVAIVPGILGEPGEESVVKGLSNLNAFRDGAVVERVKIAPSAIIEAQWLGLRPDQGQMQQGPLTIAALGADPPDRSTHFHLTLMSTDGHQAMPIQVSLSEADVRHLWKSIERLNARELTGVMGRGVDHGLVWERWVDMQTHAPTLIEGDFHEFLPQGDGEGVLRRYIDDSVNLLGELEWNLEREDAGLPPVNLVWPWGHGRRLRVPNLALQRGGIARVLSSSLRLQGLTRLAGYRHDRWDTVSSGLQTAFEGLSRTILSEPVSVTVLLGCEAFRARGMFEELDWWASEFDRRFLGELVPLLADRETDFSLILTGSGQGLVLRRGSGALGNTWPMDERAYEERVSVRALHEVVADALTLAV